MMHQETISVQVTGEKRRALDAIATDMQRDRSEIISEAINFYLETYAWQVAEIQQGVEEAEAGDFATKAEVAAVFRKLSDELEAR